MKYETPELTSLPPAINAIQGFPPSKKNQGPLDGGHNEDSNTYEDWE